MNFDEISAIFQNSTAKLKVLTPNQKNLLDPSGNCRNLIGMLPHGEAEFFAELSPFYKQPAEDYFALLQKSYKNLPAAHKPYVEYCEEMLSKCGRQGGKYSIEKLLEKISSYYSPDLANNYNQILTLGRDYLIDMIKETIAVYGAPQVLPIKAVKTFGALPSGQTKGSFAAESLGVNKISIQKFFPTTPGQRRMRNKDRAIFMDATPNVRAQERYLTAARNWLKKHFPQFFGSWLRPDIVVNPSITQQVNKKSWFIFWDYSSMDMNFRKSIAMNYILPIYETIFPERSLSIGCHFEQNFEQPIFLGDYLLEGTHSLLSGANITNDFETLYTVMLYIGAHLYLYGNIDRSRMLLALGDDMGAAVKTEFMARQILDVAMDASNAVRMIIHPEKSGVSQACLTYCRRTYYPSGKRDADGNLYGAYPSVLVANSIIQPENPIWDECTSLVADLQRLDNLYGSPDWHYLVQLIAASNYYQLPRSSSLEELRELLSTTEVTDWWFRLYGEKWNPDASISFRLFLAALTKSPKKI